MSMIKKGAALALALVMIMMTAGTLTLQTAYAAGVVVSNISVTPKTFVKDDVVTVTFTIRDDTAGVGTDDPIKNGSADVSLTVQTSDFASTGTASDLKVDRFVTSGGTSVAEYTIEAKVKAKTPSSAETTLKMEIKNDKSSPKYSRVVTVDVPADGSSTPTPTPPPNTTSNAKYTVTKVRRAKSSGGVYVPEDSNPVFDLNGSSSMGDATVRPNYYADVTVRVFDDKIPTGIGASDIITTDMGSFSYVAGTGRSIKVAESSAGYCEIEFEGLRYSGNNNKQLSFRIKKSDGSYNGYVYTDISECKTNKEIQTENNATKPDKDEVTLDVETPYVIVSKYSYGGGNVTAGDTFPLSMTFYNTSEVEAITNMMITVTVPDGLMLTSSSNTFYVEQLEKHGSITKSVQVTAKPDAKPQSHTIGVAMKYQYVDHRADARRTAETTENIAIPVTQVDRFNVTAVEIPMEVMLGEETSVTVNFVNKGRSESYNLSAEIEGNIQNPGQNQNLGNLASGATGSADFYILPQEVGICTGEIKITYEDTNMQEKSATIRYSTTVKSPEEFAGNMGMPMGGMMPGMGGMEGEVNPAEGEPKSKLPIIIGGCVIVAIPVLIVIKKKLDAKKKEKEDADL